MGNERHVDFQWVSNGLFELSERYGEQALRFLQDADADEESYLAELLIELIKKHIEEVSKFMNEPVSTDVKGTLNFKRPDRNKIDDSYLEAIAPLTDDFRKKVVKVCRSKKITERMDHAPLMIGAVLKCIDDMREKVEFALDF